MLNKFGVDVRNLKFYVLECFISLIIFSVPGNSFPHICGLLLSFLMTSLEQFLFLDYFLCFKISHSEESNWIYYNLSSLGLLWNNIQNLLWFWWLYTLLLSSTSFLKEKFRKFSTIYTYNSTIYNTFFTGSLQLCF